jgi:hypothetical protein
LRSAFFGFKTKVTEILWVESFRGKEDTENPGLAAVDDILVKDVIAGLIEQERRL